MYSHSPQLDGCARGEGASSVCACHLHKSPFVYWPSAKRIIDFRQQPHG